jgi:maleylacetoacetate isomerase/maleylpyruvate isomerase
VHIDPAEPAMANDLVLYSYWRSSAAYRVRIALNLKRLDYELRPVHLLADGGQQHGTEYSALNPQHLVPTLLDGRRVVRQSLAIIEYLDERDPADQNLLPQEPRERARVRSLALAVACDIHPLGNLRVLQFLQHQLDVDEDGRLRWTRHWIGTGLAAIESILANHPDTGTFCQGDTPGMADACLVPQVYNARRWGVAMEAYPTIARIDAACMALEAFAMASPERQPDAA